MSQRTITVFGGSGFVGTEVVKQLSNAGFEVRVATRSPESYTPPKGSKATGRFCDYSQPDSVKALLEDAYGAVNCIGLLYESKGNSFETAHVAIPEMIARFCAEMDIERFVHVSSLGVYAPSNYGQTKMEGEQAIFEIFPKASVVRPSLIFGPEDSFFNMFANMSRFLPMFPLIGFGKTKFQPVFVGDVAKSIVTLMEPTAEKLNGTVYELGGPDVVNFREVYVLVFKYTGRKRLLLPIPMWAGYIQGFVFGLTPKPLITVDQVRSLEVDNVVTENAHTLKELGIEPTPMADVLPTYLG